MNITGTTIFGCMPINLLPCQIFRFWPDFSRSPQYSPLQQTQFDFNRRWGVFVHRLFSMETLRGGGDNLGKLPFVMLFRAPIFDESPECKWRVYFDCLPAFTRIIILFWLWLLLLAIWKLLIVYAANIAKCTLEFRANMYAISISTSNTDTVRTIRIDIQTMHTYLQNPIEEEKQTTKPSKNALIKAINDGHRNRIHN